jgi:hypothetical protein
MVIRVPRGICPRGGVRVIVLHINDDSHLGSGGAVADELYPGGRGQ